jgi:hypothetical protein
MTAPTRHSSSTDKYLAIIAVKYDYQCGVILDINNAIMLNSQMGMQAVLVDYGLPQ